MLAASPAPKHESCAMYFGLLEASYSRIFNKWDTNKLPIHKQLLSRKQWYGLPFDQQYDSCSESDSQSNIDPVVLPDRVRCDCVTSVWCIYAVSRRFCQTLKRLTSLNHLCQAARSVVHSSDVTSQMLYDWSRVDLSSICKQTIYTMDKYSERDYDMIVTRTSNCAYLRVLSLRLYRICFFPNLISNFVKISQEKNCETLTSTVKNFIQRLTQCSHQSET